MNHLKLLRRSRRLTQRELAFAVGLKPDTVTKIENGYRNPSADVIRRLAAALDCSSEDLGFFGGDDAQRATA